MLSFSPLPLFFASCLIITASVNAAGELTAQQIQSFENAVVARQERNNLDAQRWSIQQRLDAHEVPGVAVAIIQDYQVVWQKGYGTRLAGTQQGINKDTLFSVGSVSKMINAALVLRLVAEGKLDLDQDVNQLLKSWKVPNNRHAMQYKVTLRRILAHTAGFNQHGFADFQPGEDLPSVLDTLNGRRPAKHGPIRLMFTPGSQMDYSGGGTTVSQLLIEEVTGMSYPDAARHYVFEPLDMQRSSFLNPLPEELGNIAKAHDENGRPTALPRGYEAMPEMAASGLWTSVEDLSKFVIALMQSYRGENNFLPRAMVQDMMSREQNSWHGLGPRLNGSGETRVFHHGGANNSYRAWIEGHLNSGDGMVVLTNGTDGSWVRSELRKSAEDALAWPVKSDGGFDEPDL